MPPRRGHHSAKPGGKAFILTINYIAFLYISSSRLPAHNAYANTTGIPVHFLYVLIPFHLIDLR